jgi:mannosyl-oligosaccharide alpha-1,2-mannosidase
MMSYGARATADRSLIVAEPKPHRKPPHFILERILPFSFPIILVILVLLLLVILPDSNSSKPIPQDPGLNHINLDRREAIKTVFDFAWDGYYQYAFPHDELKPLSNTPGYSRNDWGATAVDALGTAILMEKSEAVKIVLAHVQSIDFNSTDGGISVFESTIRYMGGLLSAYELLTGPFTSLNTDSQDVTFLVDQAKNLAEVLSAAFERGDSLPSSVLDPHTMKGNGENSLAGAGTLVSSMH